MLELPDLVVDSKTITTLVLGLDPTPPREPPESRSVARAALGVGIEEIFVD